MPDDYRDPSEWFLAFFEVHSARFLGMPWPAKDHPSFAAMMEAWITHFRRLRVTPGRANEASLALMLVAHYPNNHLAEFFKVLPDPPATYATIDPRSRSHWKPPVPPARPARRPAGPSGSGEGGRDE